LNTRHSQDIWNLVKKILENTFKDKIDAGLSIDNILGNVDNKIKINDKSLRKSSKIKKK